MSASAGVLDAAPPVDPSYAHRWIIALTVTMASVLEILDTSIVNVAIPHMMGTLGATLDQITWVSTGYIVANVIVLPVTGWMSAYFGRRRYFAGSIALFTISSILCGNSHTLTELVVFRILQGLGGGALLSTAQATLYEVFPREEYGQAMAIFGLGVMVGPTLGPRSAGSRTPGRGRGSSTSTCRSASWRSCCRSPTCATRATRAAWRPSTGPGSDCWRSASACCRPCSSAVSGSTGSARARA
jgi:MFS family permease